MVRASLVVLSLTLAALGGCTQGDRDAVLRCTPGERVDVSCGVLGLGEVCSGFPGIRLCDAAIAGGRCTDDEAVTIAGYGDTRPTLDDPSQQCPIATAICPASGALAVSTFTREEPYVTDDVERSCRWGARRTRIHTGRAAIFDCVPDEQVTAGCGCGSLGGACSGSPRLLACDPDVPCDTSTAYAVGIRSCGSCPRVTTTCPRSGQIGFLTESSVSADSRYECAFGVWGSVSGDLGRSGV